MTVLDQETIYYYVFGVFALAFVLSVLYVESRLTGEKTLTWIIDIDNRVSRFVRVRFKKGIYYIRYFKGLKKIEIPITKDMLKEKILVKYLDNLYTVEIKENKAVLKISELNHLLKQKLINELVSGGIGSYIIYIVLGIAIGFSIGYVFNDFNYKALVQELINRTLIVPLGK